MIVKIFKIIGMRTHLTAVFLVFFTVLFSFLTRNNWDWSLDQWPDIFGNIILMISLISLISFLEIKFKARKFNGIHMIAIPTIYLFFPYAFNLEIIPILQVIMLIWGQFIFVDTLYSKNTEKRILDLSLLISVMAQFNNTFLIFYLLPLLILFNRGLKDRKHILAFSLPILLIPFTFRGLAIILPASLTVFINPNFQKHLIQIQSISYGEMVWGGVLFLSVLSCLIQLPRGLIKFSNPEFFSGFQYMIFWLFFSILYGFFGLQTGIERWFISFIPSAYFFGVFLENIKLDSHKNLTFTILVLGIILFKTFHQ